MAKNRIPYLLNNFVKRTVFTSKAKVIDPLQEAAFSEKCIVVDENDRRLGSSSKVDCHRIQKDGSLTLHRAFSVFLFNTCGEMLLQKRAESKVTFPSHVTNACCSHPIEDFPEETIEENAKGIKSAAIRRLNYELGIPRSELDFQDFIYLTRIHYKAANDGIWGEHEVDYILFMQKDVTLKPNPNEVSHVEYVKKNDFPKYLKSIRDPLTPWFQLITNSRLPIWWENLSNLDKFQDHLHIERF